MAQLTFVSINGFAIHNSTVDIGFGLYQNNGQTDGLEWPGVRMSPYSRPGESGSIVPNQFYDGRTINLVGRVSGDTPAQYALNRRSFLNCIRIIQSSLNIAQPLLLQFTTLDGLNLQCYCFVAQPPQLPDKSLEHGSFQIQLFAPDPNLYDQSVQSPTINIPTGGGLVYPAIYPVIYPGSSGGQLIVTNSGDSDTFPVLTFYGQLTTPYLKNLTTGAQFQINATLNSGYTLVCDPGDATKPAKTMVLNGNQNAMQYFNYLNTWISLQPGDNLLVLGSSLSSDTGYCIPSFRNATIGV